MRKGQLQGQAHCASHQKTRHLGSICAAKGTISHTTATPFHNITARISGSAIKPYRKVPDSFPQCQCSAKSPGKISNTITHQSCTGTRYPASRPNGVSVRIPSVPLILKGVNTRNGDELSVTLLTRSEACKPIWGGK